MIVLKPGEVIQERIQEETQSDGKLAAASAEAAGESAPSLPSLYQRRIAELAQENVSLKALTPLDAPQASSQTATPSLRMVADTPQLLPALVRATSSPLVARKGTSMQFTRPPLPVSNHSSFNSSPRPPRPVSNRSSFNSSPRPINPAITSPMDGFVSISQSPVLERRAWDASLPEPLSDASNASQSANQSHVDSVIAEMFTPMAHVMDVESLQLLPRSGSAQHMFGMQ